MDPVKSGMNPIQQPAVRKVKDIEDAKNTIREYLKDNAESNFWCDGKIDLKVLKTLSESKLDVSFAEKLLNSGLYLYASNFTKEVRSRLEIYDGVQIKSVPRDSESESDSDSDSDFDGIVANEGFEEVKSLADKCIQTLENEGKTYHPTTQNCPHLVYWDRGLAKSFADLFETEEQCLSQVGQICKKYDRTAADYLIEALFLRIAELSENSDAYKEVAILFVPEDYVKYQLDQSRLNSLDVFEKITRILDKLTDDSIKEAVITKFVNLSAFLESGDSEKVAKIQQMIERYCRLSGKSEDGFYSTMHPSVGNLNKPENHKFDILRRFVTIGLNELLRDGCCRAGLLLETFTVNEYNALQDFSEDSLSPMRRSYKSKAPIVTAFKKIDQLGLKLDPQFLKDALDSEIRKAALKEMKDEEICYIDEWFSNIFATLGRNERRLRYRQINQYLSRPSTNRSRIWCYRQFSINAHLGPEFLRAEALSAKEDNLTHWLFAFMVQVRLVESQEKEFLETVKQLGPKFEFTSNAQILRNAQNFLHDCFKHSRKSTQPLSNIPSVEVQEQCKLILRCLYPNGITNQLNAQAPVQKMMQLAHCVLAVFRSKGGEQLLVNEPLIDFFLVEKLFSAPVVFDARNALNYNGTEQVKLRLMHDLILYGGSSEYSQELKNEWSRLASPYLPTFYVRYLDPARPPEKRSTFSEAWDQYYITNRKPPRGGDARFLEFVQEMQQLVDTRDFTLEDKMVLAPELIRQAFAFKELCKACKRAGSKNAQQVKEQLDSLNRQASTIDKAQTSGLLKKVQNFTMKMQFHFGFSSLKDSENRIEINNQGAQDTTAMLGSGVDKSVYLPSVDNGFVVAEFNRTRSKRRNSETPILKLANCASSNLTRWYGADKKYSFTKNEINTKLQIGPIFKKLDRSSFTDGADQIDLANLPSLALDGLLALNFLHSRGLIHGDPHQGNFGLLPQSGRLIMNDFGHSARSGARASEIGERYHQLIASENALLNEKYTMRDDLFAFGCVLYKLLAKKYPIEEIDGYGESKTRQQTNILHREISRKHIKERIEHHLKKQGPTIHKDQKNDAVDFFVAILCYPSATAAQLLNHNFIGAIDTFE